tara:strand:- start:1523 stop:1900 length:378 start_codon:yes stop_codon:yes gene_type:complete
MLTATGTGRITNARLAQNKKNNDEWLEVTIACDDFSEEDNSLRIQANNKNGMLEIFKKDLEAFNKAYIGRHVTFSGSIVHKSVSSHYFDTRDGSLKASKNPGFKISYASIERSPLPKVEAKKVAK